MQENTDYVCQYCAKSVREEDRLVFEVLQTNGKRVKISLSATPGHYGYTSDEETNIKVGDKLTFYCPHCDSDLQSHSKPEFVQIEMHTGEEVFNVVFSPVYGEHKSYVVNGDELVDSYSSFMQVRIR